jgi:hypothetical protein
MTCIWNVDKIPKQKNELLMMWIMWQSLGRQSIRRNFGGHFIFVNNASLKRGGILHLQEASHMCKVPPTLHHELPTIDI